MAKIIIPLIALSLIYSDATAQNVAKAKTLSPQDELKWINAVERHKTDDGAAVLAVLQFVQHVRPTEIKFGNFDVAYNGATGLPEAVVISYWLGMKRLPDDGYINLSFNVNTSSPGLDIKPTAWPFSSALQKGRDAFLAAVDEEYEDECIDAETKRHLC